MKIASLEQDVYMSFDSHQMERQVGYHVYSIIWVYLWNDAQLVEVTNSLAYD